MWYSHTLNKTIVRKQKQINTFVQEALKIIVPKWETLSLFELFRDEQKRDLYFCDYGTDENWNFIIYADDNWLFIKTNRKMYDLPVALGICIYSKLDELKPIEAAWIKKYIQEQLWHDKQIVETYTDELIQKLFDLYSKF